MHYSMHQMTYVCQLIAGRAGVLHAQDSVGQTSGVTQRCPILKSARELKTREQVLERLRLMRSARQLVALARFTIGARVELTIDDGRVLQGEITRLNRKTATVCCNPSGNWRVSPSLSAR